jgi:hypothetical protein
MGRVDGSTIPKRRKRLQKSPTLWHSLGENQWWGLGENAWYIMARKLTLAAIVIMVLAKKVAPGLNLQGDKAGRAVLAGVQKAKVGLNNLPAVKKVDAAITGLKIRVTEHLGQQAEKLQQAFQKAQHRLKEDLQRSRRRPGRPRRKLSGVRATAKYRQQRSIELVEESAKALGFDDWKKYVDVIEYDVRAEAPSFEVDLIGRRVITLNPEAFHQASAGQLRTTLHEMVHAMQFSRFHKMHGGNEIQAWVAFMAHHSGTEAYAFDEIIAERLASETLAKYLGRLPANTAKSTEKYLQSESAPFGWRYIYHAGGFEEFERRGQIPRTLPK